MFVYWSFETPEDQYQQTGMVERIKFVAGKVILHFFDETRWKRTLKAVY
jgi:signal peptidase I